MFAADVYKRQIPYIEASRAPHSDRSRGKLIKYALDSLRSGDGYFSPFLGNDTEIEWTPEHSSDAETQPESFTVRKSGGSLSGRTSKTGTTRTISVTPNRALTTRIGRIRQAKTTGPTRAIFVPTERLLCSELTTPAALQLLKLSLIHISKTARVRSSICAIFPTVSTKLR